MLGVTEPPTKQGELSSNDAENAKKLRADLCLFILKKNILKFLNYIFFCSASNTNDNNIVARAGAPLAALPSHTSISAKLDALADIGGFFIYFILSFFLLF